MTRPRTVYLMTEPKRRKGRSPYRPLLNEMQWRMRYIGLVADYFRKAEKAKRKAYERFAVYKLL